jgi:Na+/H+-dicarboxylate symporter
MNNINRNIFIAALLGILLGFILKFFPVWLLYAPILELCDLIGQLFIKSLKMILVPLVFFSIIVGVSNLGSSKKSSSVWKYTLTYFFSTMAIAIFVALLVMNFINPGVGMIIESWPSTPEVISNTMSMNDFLKQFILSLFSNPFHSLSSSNILPIIIFSILIGASLNSLGQKSLAAKKVFESLYEVMLRIVHWIMMFAPLGILALLATMIEGQSAELFSQLSIFVFTVIAIILIHGLIVIPSLLFFFTKITPIELWRSGKPAFISAFATSSSAATLPLTLSVANDNFKVPKSVSNFVLPLGATINMDGTALYEAAAALFIANLVGMDLALSQQLILFFIAMVASIGAPGIPSAGMVTMAMVLQVLGLPLEALALLLPMDRLLDTFRTTINVEGDLVGALIVQKVSKL